MGEPATAGDVSIINTRDSNPYLELDDAEEEDVFNMASLSNFVLLGHTLNRNEDFQETYEADEDQLNRLSLAYEKLHSIPKILVQEMAGIIKILDLSHNEFENIDFLREFKVLTTLICDHNLITSNTNIPYMPKLELLWLNHCKIASLYPWAKKLQLSCPNLRYLSLMGNPVAPSYLNGGNFYEYLQYRLFIISLFPKLVHLDDRPVTPDQRTEAERMYRKPLMERLVMKTPNLPEYLRHISGVVSDILTPAPSFVAPPEKNVTPDQRTEAERMYRKPLMERLVMKTPNLPEYLRHISGVVSDILTPAPSFVAPPEKNVII